jgi:3-oxoadipate enol-lactonase
MWRDVVPVLAAQRRVLAYDLRGHGHAASAPKPFTLHRLAADLGALLDALGLERAAVVGLSLGGAVAQYFTLANPERVAALSLVCTMARSQGAFLDRALAAEREGMAAQLEPTLRRWFTPRTLLQNGWAVEYARDRILSADVTNWAASWRALAEVDTEDRLSEITAPTQVIAAELDPSTPPELMRGLAARIPNADFHIVPAAGHMLSLEKPTELAALLLDLPDA